MWNMLLTMAAAMPADLYIIMLTQDLVNVAQPALLMYPTAGTPWHARVTVSHRPYRGSKPNRTHVLKLSHTERLPVTLSLS